MPQLYFITDFCLVAAMNPCLCGYYGDVYRQCNCTATQVQKDQKRISGPHLSKSRNSFPYNISKRFSGILYILFLTYCFTRWTRSGSEPDHGDRGAVGGDGAERAEHHPLRLHPQSLPRLSLRLPLLLCQPFCP